MPEKALDTIDLGAWEEIRRLLKLVQRILSLCPSFSVLVFQLCLFLILAMNLSHYSRGNLWCEGLPHSLPCLELLPPIEVLRLVWSYKISIICSIKMWLLALMYQNHTKSMVNRVSQAQKGKYWLTFTLVTFLLLWKHHEQGNLWKTHFSWTWGPIGI